MRAPSTNARRLTDACTFACTSPKLGYPQSLQAHDSIGRGGAVLTRQPLRPRQVRDQAALRPDICAPLDFKPLPNSCLIQSPVPSAKLVQDCLKSLSVRPD